jgi:hypothetical protein
MKLGGHSHVYNPLTTNWCSVIADRPNKSEPSTRIAVDESLISPKGWMRLDPIPYLKSTRAQSASADRRPAMLDGSVREDVLDLTIADMAAARLTRSLRASRTEMPGSRIAGSSRVPASDIVAIGGRDLRRRTPEQPFLDEAELANDNLGRFVLLLILLLTVAGGYAYTTFRADDRRAIEVAPPLSPQIRIVSLERGASFEPGQNKYPDV